MTPETAGFRLLCSCLLGGALGLYYGFLRPLRRRHQGLADGLFLLGAVWVWLYQSFGICGGDLRLGYFLGLLAGGLLWERTAGRVLRPVFSGFWGGLAKAGRLAVLPLKNFRILQKFCLHLGKNGLQ